MNNGQFSLTHIYTSSTLAGKHPNTTYEMEIIFLTLLAKRNENSNSVTGIHIYIQKKSFRDHCFGDPWGPLNDKSLLEFLGKNQTYFI